MTKSRTLRKAGAVALSLAMALSIAGTTPAQAASKVKLSSKKGTIKVNKTKTVTIKNTKKSNIKKVKFTYSKKKIAKATRKGLKITVKGLKAGKTTITAKITLKKAVAGKKSYSLKYTATVKETTPVVEELNLDRVESAGRIKATYGFDALGNEVMTSAGGVNILVAYFSSAVANFSQSDVQIRNVSSGKLYTVEKVDFASDKKSATLTLTGTAAAAVNTDYLQSLTEYELIINTNGKTLAKKFVIPAVLDGVVVTGVDAKNKKLEIDGQKYDVPDTIKVDYFDILGKTVTVEIDTKGAITSLKEENLTVVYGQFSYVTATATTPVGYKDAATGTVYSTVSKWTANQSTYPTVMVTYGTGYAVPDTRYDGHALDADHPAQFIAHDLAWGKLVLNPDKTIRSFQGVEAIPSSAYVTKNDAGVITNGAGSTVNVKDFQLVGLDGKTIAAADVAVGSALFYNSSVPFGYVSTATVTGAFEGVRDSSYDFAGKEYKHSVTDIKDAKEANYTLASAGDLKTAKTQLTLITDLAGKGRYAFGEAAAATTTVYGFVTKTGTVGTGTKYSADVEVFNPATSALETYSWTSDGGANFPTSGVVQGWYDSQAMNLDVLEFVKLTVKTSDGKTVTKCELVGAQAGVGGAVSVDGAALANGTKIDKKVKNIGTTTTDGMNTAATKVVVYKLPKTATTAWAVSNFTIYDFSTWSGELAGAAGVFDGTEFYGTPSKALDFIAVDAAQQAKAGAVGMEDGKTVLGWTLAEDYQADKRVVVLQNGEDKDKGIAYSNFDSGVTLNGSLYDSNNKKGCFVEITLSKNYETDKGVKSIGKMVSGNYAAVTPANTTILSSEACDGKVLRTLEDGAFDIASDCIFIKDTVKDGDHVYTLAEGTSVPKWSTLNIITAKANTTTAKAVLFTAAVATVEPAAATKLTDAKDAVKNLSTTDFEAAKTLDEAADIVAAIKGVLDVTAITDGIKSVLSKDEYTTGATSVVTTVTFKDGTSTDLTWTVKAMKSGETITKGYDIMQ